MTNNKYQIQASIFEFLAPQIKTNTTKKFVAAVHKVLASHPEEEKRILYAYGVAEDTPDDEALSSIFTFITDVAFNAPTLSFARGWKGNAYVYYFNEGNPWEGPWKGRANHILDTLYIFQNFREFMDPGQEAVGVAFAEDFFKFCHGLAPWPAITPGQINNGLSARVYGYSERGLSTSVVSGPFGGESQRRSVLFDCATGVSLDDLANILGEILSG